MLDPVLLAQLHRVAAKLGGELIHDPLDGVCRLGPAGTAVGVGRRLGREHTGAEEPVRRHLVDRREHEGAEDRDTRGDELQVGAHVGEQLDLEPEQRAVLLRRDRDVLDLVAAVRRGLVVLAARLGPLDRPAELAGDDQREDLLGVDVELGAEAAAHVGGHDAQLVLGDARGEREHHAQHVGDLGGGVQGELVGRRDRRHDDGARLHRRRQQTLLAEPARDHDRVVTGGRDGLVEVRPGTREVEQEALVGALVAVHQRRTLLEGLLHVHDRRELFVLDRDGLEGVGRGVAVAGDDDGDTVADVAHLIDCQRGVYRRDHVGGDRPRTRHGGAHHVGEVLAAVGGDHTGHVQRGRHVNRDDLGVRHRAAQHGHVQQPRQGNVVRPVGLAGDKLGVLLAATPPAELPTGVRRGHRLGVLEHLLGHEAGIQLIGHTETSLLSAASWKDPGMAPSPRISLAAESTALTMFW